MTYEQSLKNIETLKNLVWPWNTDYVFFDFKTETEFEVLFLDKENSYKIEEFLPVKHIAKLPIAHIRENEQGQEVFYYADDTVTCEYNLTTETLMMNYSEEQFKTSFSQIRLEMAALARKLENM